MAVRYQSNVGDGHLEIEKIKKKLDNQDKNMEIVFGYLDELLEKKNQPVIAESLGLPLDVVEKLWAYRINTLRFRGDVVFITDFLVPGSGGSMCPP